MNNTTYTASLSGLMGTMEQVVAPLKLPIAPLKLPIAPLKLPIAPLKLPKVEQLSVPSTSQLVLWCGALLVAYTLWEQLQFWRWRQAKDGALPGPRGALPLIGSMIDIVKDPYGYWEQQRAYACPGLSWNSIMGKFTIFVTDPKLSRFVFNHNSSDTLLMALHPSGKIILGRNNMAYLHGPGHKELRRSVLGLFTRRALAVYIAQQDAIIRTFLDELVGRGAEGALEVRGLIRDMNAITSQQVFVGPYLDDPLERQQFSDAYRDMTEGFLCFPLSWGVYKGWKGRHYILQVLAKAAQRSKERMAAGQEPQCLLDFWTTQVLKDMGAAESAGKPLPWFHTNDKIADVVMDFLFASQDASTASLCWIMTLMADHPDVLRKVREEQERLRPNLAATIPGDLLNDMQYTRQVVKECLRYRPPAPMVPQIAQVPFKLTDTYTAPKGSLIIPSITAALMQGYEKPHQFDPDRFSPERKEDIKFASNYLVFGFGPHYCLGKEYANNHLMAFLAILSTTLDFSRVRSDKSDDWVYLPTVYPGDSVFSVRYRAEYLQAQAAAATDAAPAS